MEACADPTVARRRSAEAPSVLGAGVRPAGAGRRGLYPLLEQVFVRASEAEGIGVPGDPTIAAALLLGILNEAAALIAAAPDDAGLRMRVSSSVDAFFLTKLLG